MIDSTEVHGYGNGEAHEEWFKQKLGKKLIQQSIDLYRNHSDLGGHYHSLNYLKDLLFRVSECNYKSPNPNDWAHVNVYTEDEKYWNSSIFLD